MNLGSLKVTSSFLLSRKRGESEEFNIDDILRTNHQTVYHGSMYEENGDISFMAMITDTDDNKITEIRFSEDEDFFDASGEVFGKLQANGVTVVYADGESSEGERNKPERGRRKSSQKKGRTEVPKQGTPKNFLTVDDARRSKPKKRCAKRMDKYRKSAKGEPMKPGIENSKFDEKKRYQQRKENASSSQSDRQGSSPESKSDGNSSDDPPAPDKDNIPDVRQLAYLSLAV